MKPLQSLLADLHTSGVRLWLEEDRLRVSAPPGILTEERRAALAHYKTDLLLLLEKQAMQTMPPVPRTGREPLSYAQQRLWFLQQVEANSAYNMPAILHLQGALQYTVLQGAIDTIVARHENLRTTFHEEGGEIYQRIAPPAPVAIPIIDLTPIAAMTVEAAALALADDELRRPFDLAQGPLLRVLLIRVTPTPPTARPTTTPEHYLPEHYLVVNMHHIISDGVSVALLIDEFSALYSAGVRGEASPLAPLAIQYTDFAAWQRKWLGGKFLEQQAAYWQVKLQGAPPLLELPTDRPRPAQQSFRGKTLAFTIDQATTRGLNHFSQQHKATPFMTLLGVFALLLQRYSSQRDILIGTPIAGRTQPAVERLIGLFINTLVMRVDFSAGLTGTALIEQVRQTALDAYEHQDLPFERLIDLLHLERNRSYNPVFQVMFAMQPSDPEQLRLTGLQVKPVKLETDIAKFDLNLMIGEKGQGLAGELEYNSDLFDAATAQRLVNHFQNLLTALLAQPTAPVATLPMLDAGERQQLLVDWNDTTLPYPDTACLHQLIEAQAARTPEAVAVIVANELTNYELGHTPHATRHLTYRELNIRANQLAHHLQHLGVQPDDRVGVYLERSAWLPVALLGILKAGAAYVPLDPAFPQARLRLMIEDAAPAVLITESGLAADFADAALPQFAIDEAWSQIVQQPTHNPSSAVGPDNLAYVIYTSGSTGKPKGVELRHQSVVNFLTSMQQKPGLTAQDRLLAVTTISFDIAVLELYLPLLVGATILLADQRMSADPDQLLQLLPQATIMQATPATWRMLLLAGWQGQPGLRILVGGEALPVALAEQLLTCGDELWNLYGPTETTVWSSLQQVTAADLAAADSSGAVTIGRPLGNTQFYILDTNRQLVPVGVPGELYIGGAGLARGYRNLPALTDEKFVSNPFAGDAGNSRLYRTGDLARWRPDGTVEYLGRTDQQVKIRGFRIELGEIESALALHPQIRQAVVVAQSDSSGGKRLVAFLLGDQPTPAPLTEVDFLPPPNLPQNGGGTEALPTPDRLPPQAGEGWGGVTKNRLPKAPAPLTTEELRAFLRPKLPDYMIPAAFVTLDSLPLTPNGKVDRRALQQMTAGVLLTTTVYVPPTTPTEIALVDIWAAVLKLDPSQIGIHHNFFDLGGHSLLAVQVLSRVRTAFTVELPIRDLMDNPTIAGIAAALQPMQQLATLFQALPTELAAERESIEL